VLELEAADAAALAADIGKSFGGSCQVLDGRLRCRGENVHELAPRLMQQFGGRVQRLTLSHPSLEDVFIQKTGKRLHAEAAEGSR
jgi:ABC-2 type transport system ATP-binding protein